MSTMNNTYIDQLYRLTDSFLVEAKDQDGNDRTLERLNQDRHLFVENTMKLLTQAIQKTKEETWKEVDDTIKLWQRHSIDGKFTEIFESIRLAFKDISQAQENNK